MQKGRKAQKQSYKVVLGAKRSRNFRKKKEKIASLGKNLGNFLEKYILMSSSIVKLQISLQIYQ